MLENEINYESVINQYPWIIEKNHKCVVSPDTDGILCGLFMSHHLNWKIVGYYDGKTLVIERSIKPWECIFLDMEIFNKKYKSMGQHMLLYNNNSIPDNWDNFQNCINPNNIRGFEAKHHFRQKYPFATIHLLMCIVRTKIEFSIPRSAITVLLYVDGTFKNLLNYPENCIGWLHFLKAKDKNSPIAPILNIFASQRISSMMHDLERIFDEFRKISNGQKREDKIKLSNIKNGSFDDNLRTKTIKLMQFLSNHTEWTFKKNNWAMNNLISKNLKKVIIPTGKLNDAKYREIISKNPVSFAITGTKRMEYTENHYLFGKR